MGSLAINNIKVYANTNFTSVGRIFHWPNRNPLIRGFGSILNLPLTNDWYNNEGWIFYDTEAKTATKTNKDLILQGYKSPFILISRTAGEIDFNVPQNRKYYFAVMYYSKKYRDFLKQHYGESKYNSWIQETKAEYNFH